MKFKQETAQFIFDGSNDCLFLFVDADGEASSRALADLKEISKKLKGNILMCYSGARDGMDEGL